MRSGLVSQDLKNQTTKHESRDLTRPGSDMPEADNQDRSGEQLSVRSDTWAS